MWFDVGKIRKDFDKHSDHFSKEILKDIPALLNNPIAITEYRGPKGNINNTVTVWGLVIPDTNIPVAVGVMMVRGEGNRMIVNRILTVHADSHAAINDGNILYLNEDKKRTRNWFQVCGISVPLNGTSFGFIRSISFVDKKSNTQNGKLSVKDESDQTQTEAFKRWFGDSKVVNADGTPKVMYYGTAAVIRTSQRRLSISTRSSRTPFLWKSTRTSTRGQCVKIRLLKVYLFCSAHSVTATPLSQYSLK